MSIQQDDQGQWINSLVAGGVAGLTVDFVLYPLDTIKTRLQSQSGFWHSGGFSKVYSGIGFTLSGSIPNAAVFFLTYDTTKSLLNSNLPHGYDVFSHMFAAVCGEVAACSIRMPIEVVKQRSQTSRKASLSILKQTYQDSGLRGLYRGYLTTVCREVPFALLQFPIWEELKKRMRYYRDVKQLNAFDSALCGAVSGALAGALTTPMDVAKTRIILAERNDPTARGDMLQVISRIWREERLPGLFAGALPRVLWISIGGAIFLGGYDITKNMLQSN